MLTNLLPGVRELRTPLAVGATWLAALALALARLIPAKSSDTSGVLKSVYIFMSIRDGAVGLAVVAFLCYVLGVAALSAGPRSWLTLARKKDSAALATGGVLGSNFDENVFDEIIFREAYRAVIPSTDKWQAALSAYAGELYRTSSSDELNLLGVPSMAGDPELARFSIEDIARVKQFLRERVESGPDDPMQGPVDDVERVRIERYCAGLIDLISGDPERQRSLLNHLLDSQYYRSRLAVECRSVPSILSAEKKDVFDRWDRLASEAEFRLGMAPPCAAVLLVCSVQSYFAGWSFLSVSAFAVLAGLVYLAMHASGKERKKLADDQLVECLRVKIVSSPTLEEISRSVVHWRTRGIENTMRKSSGYIGYVLGYLIISNLQRERASAKEGEGRPATWG